MPQRRATKTQYLTADRSRLVDEGDPDAAFLFVREGGSIDDAEATRLGLEVEGEDVPAYDAKRDHFEKHGGMDPTGPRERARRDAMLSGVDDPDGPAAPGERGASADGPETGDVKAKGPAANKARAASDNK
jgi:hypothetical protein